MAGKTRKASKTLASETVTSDVVTIEAEASVEKSVALMTFDQFMLYWAGRGCDWDGRYGNQCVDLWRHYVNSVWGYPQSPGVIGAADIWDSYDQLRWTRIPNTPKGVPQKGDVLIWSRDYGPNGHVAMAVGIGDTTSFYSYDQNLPTKSLPHIQHHNYNALYGWLRAK